MRAQKGHDSGWEQGDRLILDAFSFIFHETSKCIGIRAFRKIDSDRFVGTSGGNSTLLIRTNSRYFGTTLHLFSEQANLTAPAEALKVHA